MDKEEQLSERDIQEKCSHFSSSSIAVNHTSCSPLSEKAKSENSKERQIFNFAGGGMMVCRVT